MATDSPHTTDELAEFQRYINEHHNGTLNGHTVDQAIAEFKQHQRELAELREKVRQSEESAEREGTQPLTKERLDSMIEEVNTELRNEGVLK